MTDTTDELVVERRGPVLLVRLNRPEVRNALSWSMIGGISQAVAEAETDPEIRVLVLTGTGDRAFCSGIDLRTFAEGTSATPDGSGDGFMRMLAGEVGGAGGRRGQRQRGGGRFRAAARLRPGGGVVGGVASACPR